MPNWTRNVLHITGEPQDIADIKKVLASADEDFVLSFGSTLPMPDIFKFLNTGGHLMDDDTRCQLWTHDCEDPANASFKDPVIPIKNGDREAIVRMYGHENWRDFALDKWGCKWDASEPSLNVDEPRDLEYSFDTPWGPPTEWYYDLVQRFPKLAFALNYQNEDDGYETTHSL